MCIIPGEKAWQVILDVFAISDDGNLFDAFGLAAIAALRSATVPAERFEVGEDMPLDVSKDSDHVFLPQGRRSFCL